jgi:hypothetical protein
MPVLMAALVATQVMGFGAARKLLNNTYGDRPGRPYTEVNRDRLLEKFRKAEKDASEYGNLVLSQLMLTEKLEGLE